VKTPKNPELKRRKGANAWRMAIWRPDTTMPEGARVDEGG
jgi:hypothetical protein